VRQAAALTLRTIPRAAALVPRAAGALPPRLRRRLAATAALALVLLVAYVGWFRDSSLVAVERVTVTGLTTRDAERVGAALTAAARDMTTLHLDRAELERAVAGYRVVRSLELRPDFPHSLSIRVIEHRPAALVASGGDRVPVAADGTLLTGLPVERRLPILAARRGSSNGRLIDARALRALRVIGAAPAVIGGRVLRVEQTNKEGVVVRLRRGPRLIFGDLSRLGAKWAAATRVLADAEARGATYIDVRLPERPAAGGLAEDTVAPVAPAGATSRPQAVVGQEQPPVEPGAAQPGQEQGAPPVEAAPQTGATPQSTAPAPAGQAPPPTSGGVPANPQP
jgi:cell division protein FtsQ